MLAAPTLLLVEHYVSAKYDFHSLRHWPCTVPTAVSENEAPPHSRTYDVYCIRATVAVEHGLAALGWLVQID